MSELSTRVNAGALAGAFQKGAAAFINSSSFARRSSAPTNASSVTDGMSRYRAGVSDPKSRLKAPMGEKPSRLSAGIRAVSYTHLGSMPNGGDGCRKNSWRPSWM